MRLFEQETFVEEFLYNPLENKDIEDIESGIIVTVCYILHVFIGGIFSVILAAIWPIVLILVICGTIFKYKYKSK